MRCAIYSRYSSELQDVRSIADQVALCRDRAQREGWVVTAEFSDAAISGASMANRPGLQDLMHAAEASAFDAVITESLDRLSRDLEDLAGTFKRLAYRGIRIVTLADGEVGTLHVGLRGVVAKLYLEDLAQKTRRGQVGRVRAGRIPGGRCYGYDVVAEGSERGRRVINERDAEIVLASSANFWPVTLRSPSLRVSTPRACPARVEACGTPRPSTARASGRTAS
jgi:DNA invertase Pin-like site-specific DNA recombinase